jgi:hypothetical protein
VKIELRSNLFFEIEGDFGHLVDANGIDVSDTAILEEAELARILRIIETHFDRVSYNQLYGSGNN